MNHTLPDVKEKILIESALNSTLSKVPAALNSRFMQFHQLHSRTVLIQLIVLAHVTYLLYGLVDWLVIPDVRFQSLMIRVGFTSLVAFTTFVLLKKLNNIKWLDLFLPYVTLIATALWFYLLSLSQSENVLTYLYAAVVFIVIANLAVQVRFLPSLIPSFLICLITFYGVYELTNANWGMIQIFSVVYLPILGVSFYISASNTIRNRRTFLRRTLNEWHRNALDQLAHTDVLTNLPNRRQFERMAENELARSIRHFEPKSLLIFDVDHFKLINDNFGHDVGDQVLQIIADITQQHWRSYDIVARFGGEEFVGILLNTELEQAVKITERLREKIENHRLRLEGGTLIGFTISIGIVEIPAEPPELKQLIRQADQALYRAKKNGRNRVEVFQYKDLSSSS